MENVVVQAMACSHRHWGMGSADVVRVWRQCSPRSATWVSWCSAGAGAMVFICASKVGVYLEILETDEASHITHARRKHTSLNKIAAIMALDQHGALLKMVVMISQHRLRSSRRPPPSAFLLLCNAKASNYRENKVFKGLAYYSKWPKVADAVIEANGIPMFHAALLTRMSTRLNSLTTLSTAASMAPGSRWSTCTARLRLPATCTALTIVVTPSRRPT